METEFKFVGKKGHRRGVRSVGVSDDTYEIITNMIDSGNIEAKTPSVQLIDDIYNIFGGNCYALIVSIAIENMISDSIHRLDDMQSLTMNGEDVFVKACDAIFPSMVTSESEDGSDKNELNFFNPNVREIINEVSPLLVEGRREFFANSLLRILDEDNRPAGEIACGLLYQMSFDEELTEMNHDAN